MKDDTISRDAALECAEKMVEGVDNKENQYAFERKDGDNG